MLEQSLDKKEHQNKNQNEKKVLEMKSRSNSLWSQIWGQDSSFTFTEENRLFEIDLCENHISQTQNILIDLDTRQKKVNHITSLK